MIEYHTNNIRHLKGEGERQDVGKYILIAGG